MLESFTPPERLARHASGYLSEETLSEAIVLLDRAVSAKGELDSAAHELCERAGIDPASPNDVQELLSALSARLTEMTGGRAEAFASALQAYPPDQRFSLPALAEVLWPSLENLRRASAQPVSVDQVSRLIAQHEGALAAQYMRHSGRSREAWQATRDALLHRLPALYARYALWANAHQGGALQRLAQTPEGVAVISATLGLITLRMPISTPLVCGVLGLVGYAGLAPILNRVQERFRHFILEALADEDAVVVRLGADHAPLRLSELLDDARPALMTAALAGVNDPNVLMRHVAPHLLRMREVALRPGGPGETYVEAVTDVVRTRFIPRLLSIVNARRSAIEGSLLRRMVRDPNGAGLVTMLATAPVSVVAALQTPWGWWDAPLMAALFFLAGRTVITVLASPVRQLGELEEAMRAEERLLQGLHPSPPDTRTHAATLSD